MAGASAIPENTARFRLDAVASICGGTLAGSGGTEVQGVVTDSRADTRGKLFVALSGERYDGHDYISAALRGGARALLVEREIGDVPVPVVRVASTLAALGALGRAHRERWGGTLIAVAGSAGKTTTRAAVSAALDAALPGQVHFVRGNLNNQIGVPLVLLGLDARQRAAAVEIGTNAPGEVATLTDIAQPNAGILTLIDIEHSEGLGSIERIEAEEASLYERLGPGAVALGNVDDERVRRRLSGAKTRARVGYGFGEGADYRILWRDEGNVERSRLVIGRPEGEPLSVDNPFLGRPGAYAVAAAVASTQTALGTELEPGTFEAAFARLGGLEPGRLTPIALQNGVLVLDDTYNSNPASLKSSVATTHEVARARSGRLWLVLGEMRELGDESPRLHREAGETLLDFSAACVISLGGEARWLLEPFERAGVPAHSLESYAAVQFLLQSLRARDVVLVKASRGVRAERVVDGLIDKLGRAG
jgi:UDP-N-acetylmuramoyl-tripeptide--D-alanyl-D-alanine ligase